MRFVFRADASLAIGAGHVMRSSAIAEEVIARGIPAVFIGAISELPWVSEHIDNLGFEAVVDESSKFQADPDRDILIIDSYTISLEDKLLRPSQWNSVVSIADKFTPPYKSNLRIYLGLTKSRMQSSEMKTVGGPEYIPFRKSIRKSDSPLGVKHLEIIVVGGGSDSTEFVSAITRVLLNLKAEFHANLFMNNDDDMDLDNRFSIIPIGTDLDKIANNAHLVFTTASTGCLEFLARGATVALGCAVNNQEQYYKDLADGNFAAPIGEFLNGKWNLDIERILELINSEFLRAKYKNNSEGLVDLNGAKRIVDEILKL